jgi:hypothetical protein
VMLVLKNGVGFSGCQLTLVSNQTHFINTVKAVREVNSCDIAVLTITSLDKRQQKVFLNSQVWLTC